MVEVLRPSMSSALFKGLPAVTVGAGRFEEPGGGHISSCSIGKGYSGISTWSQSSRTGPVDLPTPPIEMTDTQFNPLLGINGPHAYYKGIQMVPPNSNSQPQDSSVISRMKYMSKAPPPTESRRSSTQTNGGDYERSTADPRRYSQPAPHDDGNIASYLQIPSTITEVSGNLAELAAKVRDFAPKLSEMEI